MTRPSQLSIARTGKSLLLLSLFPCVIYLFLDTWHCNSSTKELSLAQKNKHLVITRRFQVSVLIWNLATFWSKNSLFGTKEATNDEQTLTMGLGWYDIWPVVNWRFGKPSYDWFFAAKGVRAAYISSTSTFWEPFFIESTPTGTNRSILVVLALFGPAASKRSRCQTQLWPMQIQSKSTCSGLVFANVMLYWQRIE